jgi:aldose 1-epimerase
MKKILFYSLALLMFAITACQSTKNNKMVKKDLFGNYDGKEVYLLTLTNKAGNVLKLTNYGAKINWIEVPDRNGKKDNVTFGYDTFEATQKGDPYFGAIVGRYANRIANGTFMIDSVVYHTEINEKPNTLHGGSKGWHSVVWETEIPENTEFPAVKFSYHSPDGEMGFPGNVDVSVVYTWTDNNEIIMDYAYTTDKKTIVAVTNHAYFNLHGAGVGDILDHEVTLNASAFIPVDSVMISTGEIRQVTGTPFDFTSPHKIGERINENYDQLILGKGYDHSWVLDKGKDVAATVYEPQSGRVLEVLTDTPGLQFYSGNFLTGSEKGHGGLAYNYRSGLCLESGFYPDSPNKPEFPSPLVNPGDTIKTRTIYRFSVKK